MHSYMDELNYLEKEARADLEYEIQNWPVCEEGHRYPPDCEPCPTCALLADEVKVAALLRLYDAAAIRGREMLQAAGEGEVA